MLIGAVSELSVATWFGGACGGVLGVGALLVVSAVRQPLRPSPRGRTASRRLRGWLACAGAPGFTPTMFVCALVFAALLSAAGAQALTGVPGFALAAGCAGGAVPGLLVAWRARLRRVATRAAWPDIVDHLVAAVRSGIALPEAVAAFATVGPEATREQFARFGREYRSTGDFGAALDRLKADVADPVLDRIAETLKMAREVGGTELVGVLRSLATALREDAATRGELQARQTWVVNAARLGVAAPWLVLAMLVTRPEGREAYSTGLGTAVIAGAAGVTVVAYRVMIAVGRLPQERRWFR